MRPSLRTPGPVLQISLMDLPLVRATITLLEDLATSRWPHRARFMPHIVVGDPTQRDACRGPGNVLSERYLGVWFTESSNELAPGKTNEVTLCLMYWPEEQYEGVVAGAIFTIRE